MALLFLSLVLLAGLGAIGTLIFGLVLQEEKILREYLEGHYNTEEIAFDSDYMFDQEFCTLHGDWKPCTYCNQEQALRA